MEELQTPLPVEAPPETAPPLEIDFAQADVSNRYDDVFEWVRPDEVAEVIWRDGAYQFNCRNRVALRVTVVRAGIFRLRYAPDGVFERDFSYAVDPNLPGEKVVAMLDETETTYTLTSDKLILEVRKADLAVSFFDQNIQLLCADAGGFSAKRTILKGWCELRMSKISPKREAYFGLGDKSCGANLRGKKFENWCTDAYGFGRESDPLYRAVPFYIAVNQGVAHGIFLDNSFRTRFDFDSKNGQDARFVKVEKVDKSETPADEGDARFVNFLKVDKSGTPAHPGEVNFWAEGGELNYYFFAGPSAEDVCRNYALLTGRPELPPLWALGFQQCRWSYYPDGRVREIAETFRRLQIPCDAIYLDIDYMDGFRVFTWDDNHFPDPAGLVSDLQNIGFQTVLMLDPGVKEDVDFPVYREGLAENYFVKTADGAVAKGPVWPGWCAFPDFTDPAVRDWWAGLHEDIFALGVAGIWNDMNEPAVFHVHHKTLADNVLHDHDGLLCSHRKAHNVYGMLMNRATHEGQLRWLPERRPFLLTRATFCGGQRYAAVWTGDNCSTWEHLQIANIQCQRLSVSGFSFCGTDIGGFAGEPDGELFVRWLQLAVFHPLMRVHSMGKHAAGDVAVSPPSPLKGETDPAHGTAPPFGGCEGTAPPLGGWGGIRDEAQLADPKLHQTDQEPWSFGEKWTPLAKKAIELRYALLPCLYTAMWQNVTEGTPVLRHLAFADPNDLRLVDIERDFLFGEHLLVSPVVQARVQRQMTYLPKGNWYYFWSGQQCSGETYVTLLPEQAPFFVREGAVLPVYPIRQWTSERPVDELTLYVYFKNGAETSHLYEDLGEGWRHREGFFSLKIFETSGEAGRFSLRQTKSGDWSPTYSEVKIFVVGLPFFVKTCTADGEERAIKEIRLKERSLYTLTVSPDFEVLEWSA